MERRKSVPTTMESEIENMAISALAAHYNMAKAAGIIKEGQGIISFVTSLFHTEILQK